MKSIFHKKMLENNLKYTSSHNSFVSIDDVAHSDVESILVAFRVEGAALSFGTHRGSFEGRETNCVEVVESSAEYEHITASPDVEVLKLPADVKTRREILAEWALKSAKKNKNGLIPVLLLPLAACGAGDVNVANPFSVLESSSVPGTWDVTPGEGGAINITQGATKYSFDPTTGDTIEVAIAGVGEIALSSGTYSAEVEALNTPSGIEAISGAGNLALTKLEAVLDADLSVVTTTGTKTVAVSDNENVTFTGDLGSGFTTSVGTDSTLRVTATTIDGQAISGAGAVIVSGDLSDDLGVDLSGVTATGGVTATESAGSTFTQDGVSDTDSIRPNSRSATENQAYLSSLKTPSISGSAVRKSLWTFTCTVRVH